MFSKMCWRHHGLPEEIVSDRDPRFTSKFGHTFWKSIDFLMQETKGKLANLAKARQDAKEAIAESLRRQKHFADKSRRL